MPGLLADALTLRPETAVLEAWSKGHDRSFRVLSRADENLKTVKCALAFSAIAVAGITLFPTAGAITSLVALAFAVLSGRKYSFIFPAVLVIKEARDLEYLESKQDKLVSGLPPAQQRVPCHGPKIADPDYWGDVDLLAYQITRRHVALAAACQRYDRPPFFGAARPPVPSETTEQLNKGRFSFARGYELVGPFVNP